MEEFKSRRPVRYRRGLRLMRLPGYRARRTSAEPCTQPCNLA